MQVKVITLWVQKDGNDSHENDDAFDSNPRTLRFAVADGATESSFAQRWARLLVEGFVEDPLRANSYQAIRDWLSPLQDRWYRSIQWEDLSWYAEMKARLGAFSSLVGLEVKYGGQWYAIAVGDSCLFHIRGDKCIRAFPLKQSGQFNSSPVLLSSNQSNNANIVAHVQQVHGDCSEGDYFLLMTDALAQWFLKELEVKRKPWDDLCACDTDAKFHAFVEHLRDTKQIRNDDTTLLRVDILSTSQPKTP
ncbi:MAG: protein phosphatase 2C domain-containing protein [Abditibacteriales bacterium]|nr:protein phosphatase 2C domain-containing protein [Abditibacteriales bacterium]MDW8364653.1 protein phosphatase 2C domain-containing protein [Abditibacteriales bacterium]